jgi:uncharacterized protein (DUF433 family)
MPLKGTEITICEIPPRGMMAPRQVGFIADFGEQEEESVDSNWWVPHILDTSFLVAHRLRWLDARQRYLSWWGRSREEEIRTYTVSVAEAFQAAGKQYPSISTDSEVMAGAPCLQNTRIPVYMVLDAIEYHGNLEAVTRAYPSITLRQVKDAIGFAKLVVECPLEDNPTSLTG